MAKKTESLFEMLKELNLKPTQFFATTLPTKKFKNAFVFDVIQTYLSFFPLIFLYGLFFTFILSLAGSSINWLIPLLIVVVPLLFILLHFIAAGLFHLILKLVGAKGSYSDTYKVLVYANFPSAAGLFLFFVGGTVLCFYSFVLAIIGFAKAHKIPYLRASVPIIVTFAIWMISIITFVLVVLTQIPPLDSPTSDYEYAFFTLEEGDRQLYTLGENAYDIRALGITYYGVTFTIDGSEIEPLKEGESYTLPKGEVLKVYQIRKNEVDFTFAE